jgi:hypothetical protein
MENNKLNNGEYVIVYNSLEKNYLNPTTVGRVEECISEDPAVYKVIGEDKNEYTIFYPTPLDNDYGMFTREEYINCLNELKEANNNKKDELINEKNRLIELKDKEINEVDKHGNSIQNIINRVNKELCKENGHIGEWKSGFSVYGTRINAWLQQEENIYRGKWSRTCPRCGKSEWYWEGWSSEKPWTDEMPADLVKFLKEKTLSKTK